MDLIYILAIVSAVFLLMDILYIIKPKLYVFSIVILALLPLDNFYFQIGVIKFRIAEVVAIFALALIILKRSMEKKSPLIYLPPTFKILLLFILFSSVSLFQVPAPLIYRGIIMQLHTLTFCFVALTVYNLFKERVPFFFFEKKIFKIFDIYMLVGIVQFLAYYGLNWWPISINYKYSVISNLEFVVKHTAIGTNSLYGIAPWYRPSSIFAEPVWFALFGVWIFLVAFHNGIISKQPSSSRFQWIIRVFTYGFLIILSGSRAAWFSSVIIILLIILTCPRWEKKFKIIFLVGVICLFVMILEFTTNIGLIKGIVEGRLEKSFLQSDYRWKLYQAQIKGFFESPIYGIGRGTTESLVLEIFPSGWTSKTATGGYSALFTLLYDTGIMGFGTFLIYIIYLYNVIRKNTVLKTSLLSSRNKSYFYGFLGTILFGLFLPVFSIGTLWASLAFLWASIGSLPLEQKNSRVNIQKTVF